ncbi:MAG: hypothetical protein ACYS9Y_09535 [Planctomycetota bacterium]|jgi:hypothetical protein
MSKHIVVVMVLLLISVVWVTPGLGAVKIREGALRDGFLLAGVDGKLLTQDSKDRWFFELGTDVNDGRFFVKPGSAIELLPSSGLEKMTNDVKKRSSGDYRLWGKVTKYEGKNFIFPTYFLPLSKVERQEVQQPEPSAPQSLNEPNDVIRMPDEVLKKLGGRRIIRTEELEKGLVFESDSMLADRIGFIEGQKINSKLVLDALGRNARRISVWLLPCHALEHAQERQMSELEAVRFKIAGIVTRYKGEYYLLLQRAIQVYTHGNFGN